MSTQNTRSAAVSLLIRVLDHRQTLDEALSQDERFNALEGSDRGFARAIASAAIRQLGQIHTVLARHVKGRPYPQLDSEVRHVLCVGAAQICCLKTPLHAAVSETVDCARDFDGARRAGGLINAVLRKLGPDSLDDLQMPTISVWPRKFQQLLIDEIGSETADRLATAQLEAPPLDLTAKAERNTWAEELGGEPLGPNSIRLSGGNVEEMQGYDEGAWWVQDVAATLPVALLATAEKGRALDMCAAPGGKTLQLAALGFDVTAIDRSAKRLRLVEQNLQRTRLKAECIAADATKWTNETPLDAVLVDAPCSSLGTLRRHPESPWIKSPDDLARFPDIQFRLLQHAASLTADNGQLVYCVCTPLGREGLDVVSKFLAENPDWQRKPVAADEVPGFDKSITEHGDVLTLPPWETHNGGCDAFFMARLVKKSG